MSPEELIAIAEAELRKSTRVCMKALRAARKAAGLCITCSKPTLNHVRCQSCRSKIAKHRQDARKGALRRSA